MEESEKMVALKKAYAEIILSTAKEAAARVMASERRLLRSQHDLTAANDEALRLLLHLKKMIDAKETESELNAISQRRRIEELEAHLQDVEDKISYLRVELRNVSHEVEKKKSEMQLLSRENDKIDAFDPKHEVPEDHSDNLEPIVPYSSDSELETAGASDVINRALSRRVQDDNCLDATEQAGQSANSPLQNYSGHSSDLASIFMGSAEHELHRNGCTQRIRAFERQHPDATLGAVVVGKECISAIGELKSKASEKEESKSTLSKKLLQQETRTPKLRKTRRKKFRFGRSKYSSKLVRCSVSSSSVADRNLVTGNSKAGQDELSSMDAKQNMQVKPAGLLQKLHNNSNYFTETKVVKGKRKRKVVRRKSLATSLSSVADADVKRHEGHPNVSTDGDETERLQCLEPLLLLSRSTVDPAAGAVDISTVVKEEKISTKSRIGEQEHNAVEEPENLICGLDPEDTNGRARNLDLRDADVAHDSDEPCKAKESRLLKYTFQRKRKKDSSSWSDEGASPEKCNTKKPALDTEDAALDSTRPCLVKETSRDSRRLAQVARQLISLSGKRW